MSGFVVKLEDMLRNSGIEDWEIMYDPTVGGYILKLDGDVIFMTKVCEYEEERK